MMLESSMPGFIEVVRSESCQKAGELWLEAEKSKKKKQGILSPIQLKFKVPLKLKYFVFRHAVNGILFRILSFVYTRSLMKLT